MIQNTRNKQRHSTRRVGWSVTCEYVLIGDVTYAADAALEFVQLLRFRRCKLNLIPLNADDDIPLRTPNASEIATFEEIVRDAGLQVFTRNRREGISWRLAGSWRRRRSGY